MAAKKDLDTVIECILRLPWDQEDAFIFRQVVLLISTARYNDMECIAIVLAAIKKEHRTFVLAILDHAFE